MNEVVERLPHVNASLNAISAVLLVVGLVLIKRRREQAHRRTMLACFGVSVLFLVSYLVYHAAIGGGRHFPKYPPPAVRFSYYAVLLTHVVLAASVPPLAATTIYFGLRDRRAVHRRLARWTFPIWLYVSITGVVVYVMLYQLYPPRDESRILKPSPRVVRRVAANPPPVPVLWNRRRQPTNAG